jgi:hypothetical protein
MFCMTIYRATRNICYCNVSMFPVICWYGRWMQRRVMWQHHVPEWRNMHTQRSWFQRVFVPDWFCRRSMRKQWVKESMVWNSSRFDLTCTHLYSPVAWSKCPVEKLCSAKSLDSCWPIFNQGYACLSQCIASCARRTAVTKKQWVTQ